MSVDNRQSADSSGAGLYHPDQPGLTRADVRWNYAAHAVEGGLYVGGLSFVAANSILPRMVEVLGGPSWVISLTPVLTMIGFNLLPLSTAHVVESLDRVKPALMITGILQRIPYFFAGLLLFFWGETHPATVLPAVVAVPLVSGFFGGLILTAWQELVAKTVPNHRRSSVFALRNIISAVIGILAGGIIATVLDRVPGTKGYGILHLIAFACLAVSFVVFAQIREGRDQRRKQSNDTGLRRNLAGAIEILRADGRLRKYLTTTALLNSMFVMVPFLPLAALRITGRPDSFLGFLVTAQMIGGIAGNAIAGYMGDRYGGRNVMLGGRALLVVSCVWAAFAQSTWEFAAIFLLQGWGTASNMVGNQTMNIEFCPLEKRSTYLAIMSFVNVPAMLVFSLGGGVALGYAGRILHAVTLLGGPSCSFGLDPQHSRRAPQEIACPGSVARRYFGFEGVRMTIQKRISYGFVVLILALVWLLHLATPFVTVLFSYFALRSLQFGKSRKWLAVTLFVLLVTVMGFGAYLFAKQAYVAIPKILTTSIPVIIDFAQRQQFELPFSDYESLKALTREAITEKLAGIGTYATAALIELVSFVIGLVVAVSLFINARFQLEPDSQAVEGDLYSSVWGEIGKRFKAFYQSFSTVMGAQILISAINTTLTAAFLIWNDFPFAMVIIVLTFLAGLLPIIGNLISNTVIVGVGFTISPHMALWSLVFLVVLHKLEYFLNSKIIGHRIRNPMWLTLLGLVIGEKLMGIPGMILAPVVLHYIKVEASKNKVSDLST